MCGIAGFWWTKCREQHPMEVLRKMGASLAHRGPDDSGYFWDANSGIGMVHRRLSIVDLSRAGHQPMASYSGRYTIVFNGEVYNFEEIRAELGSSFRWNGHSDTEVMLQAIEVWGIDSAVRRFVGMFAFAIWDHHESKLYLVRDRLGIKPLYYGWMGGEFVFASELKAIHQYPLFERRIDRDALALYMRYNYVPAPHCIFEGLRKLLPGCILTVNSPHDSPVLSQFWSAIDVARAGLQSRIVGSDLEVIGQLEEKLTAALRLRMIADVPLGAFLSGGIDSSTVVALMQSQSSRPVKTFTVGFDEDDYNEAAYAKRVAIHLGTEHTELYISPEDTRKVIPLLPAIYDEPFADSSQIPTYLVSKLARGSVAVSLSGDGGDELFGGYNRYSLVRSIWNSMKIFPIPVRKMAAELIHAVPPTRFDRLYRWLSPAIPPRKRLSTVGDKAHKLAGLLESRSPHALYLKLLSHWTMPTDVVMNCFEPETVSEFVRDVSWLSDIEELMMLTDLMNYMPDDILTKIDRASMATSLEARVPLLDHRVVEFAWKLPLKFKIRDGITKWILRQILYKYVPAVLVDRAKMGFGVPIGHWLRGPLRQWAEDLLSRENLAHHGLFNVKAIRDKWAEHLSGVRNWQYLLWDVLVFQDWFSQSVDVTHPV